MSDDLLEEADNALDLERIGEAYRPILRIEPVKVKIMPFEIVVFDKNRRWCSLREYEEGWVNYRTDGVIYRRAGMKKQKELH